MPPDRTRSVERGTVSPRHPSTSTGRPRAPHPKAPRNSACGGCHKLKYGSRRRLVFATALNVSPLIFSTGSSVIAPSRGRSAPTALTGSGIACSFVSLSHCVLTLMWRCALSTSPNENAKVLRRGKRVDALEYGIQFRVCFQAASLTEVRNYGLTPLGNDMEGTRTLTLIISTYTLSTPPMINLRPARPVRPNRVHHCLCRPLYRLWNQSSSRPLFGSDCTLNVSRRWSDSRLLLISSFFRAFRLLAIYR